MTTRRLAARIFACPTAPFREHLVLEEIKNILKDHKIPYFEDSVHNIIAGVPSSSKLKKKETVAFMAHTDHPGFHVTRVVNSTKLSTTVDATWFGGSPFKVMVGARVRLFDPARPKWIGLPGRITSMKFKKYRRQGNPCSISLGPRAFRVDTSFFGSFDFPGFQLKGDQITTRAADDLAGVVIALGALIDQKKTGSRTCPVAIFTRAEEVGFVGCLKLLKEGTLPKNLWVVSLEASKILPGAEMGKGPVLRLGDRSTLFDSDFALWQWRSALNLAKKRRSFTFQRRLMDGGSCEATALSLYNLRTTGLAVPLKNYHNMSPNGPRPEIISLQDLHSARLLCAQMGKEGPPKHSGREEAKKNLLTNYRKLRHHFRHHL